MPGPCRDDEQRERINGKGRHDAIGVTGQTRPSPASYYDTNGSVWDRFSGHTFGRYLVTDPSNGVKRAAWRTSPSIVGERMRKLRR